MPGVLLEMDSQGLPIVKAPEYGFVVSHQEVKLTIDFATQSLKGWTQLTILPLTRDLREIKIDAKQCEIVGNEVQVNGRKAEYEYEDPAEMMDVPDYYVWDAHQHKQMRERLAPMTRDSRANGALVIHLPMSVKIEEVHPFGPNAASEVTNRAADIVVHRDGSVAMDGVAVPLSAGSNFTPRTAVEQIARFNPLKIGIEFSTKRFRDGLHFVGLGEGDIRFPHVYTKHSMDPGTASCIFPCVDDPAMRCTWEISVKCSRTLGDALRKQPVARDHRSLQHLLHKKGLTHGVLPSLPEEHEPLLSDEEKLLEMAILCSGDMLNETIDIEDGTKKIATFVVNTSMAPQHIGFAIGPFEQVDLSEFREPEDDEKLGQGQKIPVLGYCLPGRSDEVRHTCAPLAHALDHFLLAHGTFTSSECRFVFVDDQARDVEHTTSLSICSNRLLFSEDIIDPEIETVRTLVHAIATQWMGITVVPEKRSDRWVTIGLSHFMADEFMKNLCGHNDYMFRQKMLTDKLVKLDHERPSLSSLGEVLHLGEFEHDFMKLKAPLVIFILDKRCTKASGSVGLTRVLTRIIMQANTGSAADSVISSDTFRRTCEKITKYRQTDSFWAQWVMGAGCPKLTISQKFNKKRLCVEVTITQKNEVPNPNNPAQARPLEKASFMREMKEDVHGVYAGETMPFFTGPMTIRIHEADGTPYEHIVDIKDGSSKIDIPYNTKYKRLKRKNLQKARQAAGGILSGEGSDEALYYCLGDVLQSEEERLSWGLSDWPKDLETQMDQESYEWIRVDADFEWLCEKTFANMPSYMFVSQLQQDRDIVAQHEAVTYLLRTDPHDLPSTILLRTVMDQRYFHGIRTMAAEALSRHCVARINWCGLRHLEKAYQTLFCYDSANDISKKMPRSNDFRDKRAYKLEMAMIRGFAKMRDSNGRCPKDARAWLLDILRFNDNTNNNYSDYFKITNLLTALTDSIITRVDKTNVLQLNGQNNDQNPEEQWEYDEFKKNVIDELDRYRRMDEWINSYHNIFTVSSLACKQRLMQASVIPLDPTEFAQYLHDGTSDFVRIKAFGALVELGLMSIPSVAALLLNVMSTDPSPYMRDHLFEIFCLGLAIFAFGDIKAGDSAAPKSATQAQAPLALKADPNGDVEMVMDGVPNGVPDGLLDANADGGLVVEEDVNQVNRQADAERTTTIEGALRALREELRNNEELKDALWAAIKSPVITLHEQTDLLDICNILYEAIESMHIKLDLPKYWKVDHLGKGVLHFNTKTKYRSRPIKPMKKPVPVPVAPPVAILNVTTPIERPPLKLQIEMPKAPLVIQAPKITTPSTKITLNTNTFMKPPKRPLPLERSSSIITVPSADDRPRKIVKLSIAPSKMLQIFRNPPNPAPVKKKHTSASVSPGPGPGVRASTPKKQKQAQGSKASPSPAPPPSGSTISVIPRTSNTPGPGGNATIKIRKPLPDSGSGAGSGGGSGTASASARKPLPDSGKVEKPRQPLPDSGTKADKPPRQPLPDTAKADKPPRQPLPDGGKAGGSGEKIRQPLPDSGKQQRQPLPATPKGDGSAKGRQSLPGSSSARPSASGVALERVASAQGGSATVPKTTAPKKEKKKAIVKLKVNFEKLNLR